MAGRPRPVPAQGGHRVGRGAGQSHFWKPVSLNKLISGNRCFFNKWKPRAEGRPSLRLRLWVFLGRGSLRIHAWLSCGVGHWPLASAATSCLSLRPQAPLPPCGPGAVSDPSAPTPRGCVSLSSSSAPCVCRMVSRGQGEAGWGTAGRTPGFPPPSTGVERLPRAPPGPSAGRAPGRCAAGTVKPCPRLRWLRFQEPDPNRAPRVSSFLPRWERACSLPRLPRPRTTGPEGQRLPRSWRLGGGGSSLRPAAVNPRS